MDRVRAVLLAGGEGRRTGRLGTDRLKPLIPFGTRCRLIDFSLANAAASGLPEVLLLAQYRQRQLMDDLHAVWNTGPGLRVHFGACDPAYRSVAPGASPAELPPAGPPERGTADALIRNAADIFGRGVTEVLVLHADHVYRFDYRPMLAAHRANRAALTVSYQRIDRQYVHLFGMVAVDGAGRLTAFQEKPTTAASDLVFAAFCIFDADRLAHHLRLLDGTGWQHDLSRDVIPAMLQAGEVIHSYPVTGYWADIGTVERYHRAHLSLLRPDPSLRLDDLPDTLRPAANARLVADAGAGTVSLLPADLVNQGLIRHSVLFGGVRVGRGALVRDSVLLPGARVADGQEICSAVVLEDGGVLPVDGIGLGDRDGR